MSAEEEQVPSVQCTVCTNGRLVGDSIIYLSYKLNGPIRMLESS